jgi:hypothetical protein
MNYYNNPPGAMSPLIEKGLTKAKRVDKLWGHEIWFANDIANGYCGKLLHINADKGFSMHFHKDKTETFYVLSGNVKLDVVDFKTGRTETAMLMASDVFNVAPELPHQLTAIDGAAVIIEASTYHRDEDSYRLWRD